MAKMDRLADQMIEEKVARELMMCDPHWKLVSDGSVVVPRKSFDDLVRRSAMVTFIRRNWGKLPSDMQAQCAHILEAPVPLI